VKTRVEEKERKREKLETEKKTCRKRKRNKIELPIESHAEFFVLLAEALGRGEGGGLRRGGGGGGEAGLKKQRERNSFLRLFSLFFLLLSLPPSLSRALLFCLRAMADLADFISFSAVEALNESNEHGFQNALKKVQKGKKEKRQFRSMMASINREPSRKTFFDDLFSTSTSSSATKKNTSSPGLPRGRRPLPRV